MSSNARRPHRITQVDSDARRGVCSICGPTWIKRKERRGFVSWTCGQLHGSYSATASARLKQLLRDVAPNGPTDGCWNCGFIALHSAQLDVHHRDGNHSNDAPANLELLCANCHRLVHVHQKCPVGAQA